ncbi:MAG: FliM/FliN family flagellar motor switch protein [Puniceicoccales bacterium]|jgi:type III secretion system YscQ/HrcQ family protein|nr:FliM/FliN family flagellar motor switch protein [Puniceicoccales bacterium]
MNSKSKNAVPEEKATETDGGEEQESFTPGASKLPEPAAKGADKSSEETAESDGLAEDGVIEDSTTAEDAEGNAEPAAENAANEGSGDSDAEEEEIAEEFPEDTETTNPAEAAELEAAAEKIAAGGRPIIEKAGQLRKEAQFVASQRMATEKINVGEIEVQLTFDVGDVILTLKELEGMKEGYTLTTDRPVDEVVNIRANGHLIGRGRLVKVEGRLGVQIEELRGSSVNAVAQ